MTRIASVVSLPGTNPNCYSSIVTTCLMRLSTILSVTFIACPVNFSPLKLPWSRTYHTFPCKGRRNEALLPVSGDLPISNDCHGDVTDHVSNCITCCSDHLHHYPRRASSFAELQLGDDRLHHINGHWDWWSFKGWCSSDRCLGSHSNS